MKKNTLLNFRIEEQLKDDFAQIVESQGFTISEVLTASIKDIVVRKKIPINILSRIDHQKRMVLSIPLIKQKVCEIIDKYFRDKIDNVALFGSYACGTQTKDSDIDLLIKAEDFGMRDLGILQSELEKSLNKEIDITFLTEYSDPYFMKVVNNEKITIYEKH